MCIKIKPGATRPLTTKLFTVCTNCCGDKPLSSSHSLCVSVATHHGWHV